MPASDRPEMHDRLRRREHLCFAVQSFIERVLLEPGERPAGVWVELALLFGEDLAENLVDERKRSAHPHRGTVGLKNSSIPREYGHAWADRRLREIHRCDATLLQLTQRCRHVLLQGTKVPAAASLRRRQ